MSKQIMEGILNGGGNSFTVKEILIAHIKNGKIFEKKLDTFIEMSIESKTKLTSISRLLRYGFAPITVGIIVGVIISIIV